MNILIIGSKGFIGSHCETYFKKNHNVFTCDVVMDYSAKNYFVIDATNSDYREIFNSNKFDFCINCSGAASVPESIVNPGRDFLLNVANVSKLLDTILKINSTCGFINLSSAAVYGNPEYLPITESHPLKPISPYGIHKKMAEDLCDLYYNNFNLKTTSVRIFSAYGEGLKKQLFWDLYLKSQDANTVSLFGTGSESRDFIHVTEIPLALEMIIYKGEFNSSKYNLATGIEMTIKKAANLFYEHFNPDISINFDGEGRIGDPVNWVADISKIKNLGFKSSLGLEKGLLNYVTWLEENA